MELALEDPGAVWEKFTCDSCHRYLSVNPIRLYSNKSIRCGRCCTIDDSMVISSGSIANQFLFKCVNRFDGCRELLTNDLVVEHEKNCLSKKYVCPLCPPEIPIFESSHSQQLETYLLIKHFQETHKINITRENKFSVRFRTASNTNLLYNIDDYLFFISLKIEAGSFFLSAVYVGSKEEAKIIMQQFHITDVSTDPFVMSTGRKTCDHLGCPSPQGFSVKTCKFESSCVSISINLDLEKVELFKRPHSKTVYSFSTYRELQKIFLSPVILNSNPKYSIDITGKALVITEDNSEKVVVTFQCCICFVKLGGPEINTNESGRNSFCELCSEYYKTKKANVQIKKFSVPQELRDNLKFFCKWNCGDLIPYSAQKIKHYEEFCPLQPLKVCPVKSCVFEGDSHDLRNHFQTNHAVANLYLNSTTRVVDIDWSIKTPGKKCSYFWMDNKFVLFKEVIQGPNRIFSVKYCSKECATAKLQPAIIVYDKKYVGKFKNNFVYTMSTKNDSFKFNIILESIEQYPK